MNNQSSSRNIYSNKEEALTELKNIKTMLKEIKRERSQAELEYTNIQNKINVIAMKSSAAKIHTKNLADRQSTKVKIHNEVKEERERIDQMIRDDQSFLYELKKLQRNSIKDEEKSVLKSFRRSVSVQNMKTGSDIFRQRNEIKEFIQREKEILLNDRKIRVKRINEKRNKAMEKIENERLKKVAKKADEVRKEYEEELKKRDLYLGLVDEAVKVKSSAVEFYNKSKIGKFTSSK